MRRDRGPARLMYRALEILVVPALQRSRISPAQLTWSGLVISAAAGLAYLISPVLAGCLALAGGLFDAMDGLLARKSCTAGPRGAFLDSTLDRYGEAFLFLGIWAYLNRYPDYAAWGAAAVIAALFGSNMVSYTRARGEALGASYTRGFFTRDERLLILAAGSLADPLAPGLVLFLAIAFLALGANLAAIFRFKKILSALAATPERESQPKTAAENHPHPEGVRPR